jgi:ABC-type nitrate/sulfonate/bicarbonate transport system permease component
VTNGQDLGPKTEPTDPSSRAHLGGVDGSRRRRVDLRRLGNRFVPFIVPLGLLAVWEAAPIVLSMNPRTLPRPSEVAERLVTSWDTAAPHTWATVQETLIGYSVAVVIAVLLGLAMDQITWVRRGLYPVLVASQTIPVVAIAPLLIIWFGFVLLPKVLVIILVTFFPITIGFLDGLGSTELETTNLLKTMGATRLQRLRYARIPNAMPSFFTGLRISITYAVVAAIFAEYVGAIDGLGVWMQVARARFDTVTVFVAIVITATLTVIMALLASLAARLTMPWYYAQRGMERGRRHV